MEDEVASGRSFIVMSSTASPVVLSDTTELSATRSPSTGSRKHGASVMSINKLVRLSKSCDRAFRPILASIRQQTSSPEDFDQALSLISKLCEPVTEVHSLSAPQIEAMFKTIPKLEQSIQTLYKKPLTAVHATVVKAFLASVPEEVRNSEIQPMASPKSPTLLAAPPRFVSPRSPEAAHFMTFSLEKHQDDDEEVDGEEEQQEQEELRANSFSPAQTIRGKVANKKKIAGLVENLFKGGGSNLEIQRNGLHSAIRDRDMSRLRVMVQDLMYETAQALTEDGTTALHLAAELGFNEGIALLIKQGASVIARDKNGLAPIHRAARSGHMETVQLMTAHTPAEVAQGCIHLAAMANQPSVIRGVVQAGTVDINCPSSKTKDTALHLAARNGANEALAVCLELNANVCLLNAENRTALQEALYSRSIEKSLLNKLLERTMEGDHSVLLAKDVHGQTMLHAAAAYNDPEICRRLLDMGISPNEADLQGRTPLFEAAKNGSFQTFSTLIEGGADPTLRSANGRTVAHELGPGSEEIARLLARDFPELLSIKDSDGEIPAMVVAKRTEVSNMVVDTIMAATPPNVLREARDVVGRDILHCCLEASRIELVKQYMARGDFSPNNVNTVTGASTFQVACAIAGDDIDLLQLLIDHGANLRHQARDGTSLAHILVLNDFIQGLGHVVSLDKELVNLTNAKGQTPCHIAAEVQNAAAFKLLVEVGEADLEVVDLGGDTVLLTAAKNGAEDVVEACIDAGVGLDTTRTIDGKTSVYEACFHGYKEVVRKLVAAGADLAVTDHKGWHPLHAAAWGPFAERLEEYPAIVALLLEGGAPVDVENVEGSTPLYFAARKGHLVIVQELLKYSPRLRGKTYETDPLAAAQTERNADVSVALLRAGYPVLEVKNGKTEFIYDTYGQTPFHNALILQDDSVEHEVPEPAEIAVLYDMYPKVDWANLPDQRGLHPLVLTALIYDMPYCTFYILKRGATMKGYSQAPNGLKAMVKHFPTVEPYSTFFNTEVHLMTLAAHFGRESALTFAAFLRMEGPELGDTSIQELFPFAEAKKAEAPPMPSELVGA